MFYEYMSLRKVTEASLLKEGYSYLCRWKTETGWYVLSVLDSELTDVDFGTKYELGCFEKIYELPQ